MFTLHKSLAQDRPDAHSAGACPEAPVSQFSQEALSCDELRDCADRAAGEYSLALRCAGDDTLLGGSLLPVVVTPGPVAVSRCRVSPINILHHQHLGIALGVSMAQEVLLDRNLFDAAGVEPSDARREACSAYLIHILATFDSSQGVRMHQIFDWVMLQAVLKGAAAEGRCTAGEEVAVQLQLRDQYGNPAEAAADVLLAVEATGAADIKFEPAAGGVFWCLLVPHFLCFRT